MNILYWIKYYADGIYELFDNSIFFNSEQDVPNEKCS